jgi:hypothetical protein
MDTNIVKQEQAPATPFELLQLAVSNNMDIDKLAQLMDLQKRWEDNQARKAFFNALSEFQSNVPEIRKTKKVGFDTKSGGRTDYNYAPLADIVRQIKDTCKECGISYRWEIQDSKEEIKITCLVTHIDGHTESTTMTVNPDASGSKNAIQARGSAIEYGKRYTLIGALGLSTADTDTDGQMVELTADELHGIYMTHYNELIKIDNKFSGWHPDNWKTERNAKIYSKAIGEIKKKLADLKK